jgi:hypothetical protein
MPKRPVPPQTHIAIQNTATRHVDHLGSQGSTLTQSALLDYGIPGCRAGSQSIACGCQRPPSHSL